MKSLGILQASLQEESSYINKIAYYSAKKGIDVYRFTPFSFKETNEDVLGKKYNPLEKQWLDCSFPLPKYIYDRFFYPRNRKYHKKINEQIKRLKNKCTFLGCGLPNKWAVYKHLIHDNQLKQYLPKTERLTKHSLYKMLESENQVVIKPLFGSGGNGIYVICKRADHYTISDGKKSTFHIIQKNNDSLYTFLLEQLNVNHYLIQPFLQLQRKDRPIDLRIVLQKGDKEAWSVVGKGFRIGKKQSYLSNLQAGGTVLCAHQLFQQYSPSVQEDINNIVALIPRLLEQSFFPLFELGIDIGIDNNENVWILEVNSKPGYQTVVNTTSTTKRLHELFSGPANLITYYENSK